MDTDLTTARAGGDRDIATPDPRRWLALAVIGVAELMIVLDAAIVNVALPSAQHALHISNADRQWVVTAYTLSFGGLLLLGGRIADYLGRKRAFVIGLLGFALASAIGGVAQNGAMLFGARALQGAFAAVLAPSALSLISVTFVEPRERATAFGLYGSIAGGGAAMGLVLGGILTEFTSWRWCLLVNTPIALVAAVFAVVVIRESRATGNTRYDVPGAVSVTGGLVALVYAFTAASQYGWSSPLTLGVLGASVVLLVVFVGIETRSSNPLVPMRLVVDRTRGGAYLVSLLTGLALFGIFLFLTYYFQGTLGYSALQTGLAFLPLAGGISAGSWLASRLLPLVGPRALITVGLLAGAVGTALLIRIGLQSNFAPAILPAEILLSISLGIAFVPLGMAALTRVGDHDAGVASAALGACQQVGGALGTALLNTIAASATAAFLAAHLTAHRAVAAATVHGYTVGFTLSAVLLLVAAIVALLLVRPATEDELGPGLEGVPIGH